MATFGDTREESNVTSLLHCANISIKAKNYKDALVNCDQVLQMLPEHSVALETKVKCLCLMNRYEEALKTCNQWVRIDTQNSKARAKLSKIRAAVDALKACEENDGSDGEMVSLDDNNVCPPDDNKACVADGNNTGAPDGNNLHFNDGNNSLSWDDNNTYVLGDSNASFQNGNEASFHNENNLAQFSGSITPAYQNNSPVYQNNTAQYQINTPVFQNNSPACQNNSLVYQNNYCDHCPVESGVNLSNDSNCSITYNSSSNRSAAALFARLDLNEEANVNQEKRHENAIENNLFEQNCFNKCETSKHFHQEMVNSTKINQSSVATSSSDLELLSGEKCVTQLNTLDFDKLISTKWCNEDSMLTFADNQLSSKFRSELLDKLTLSDNNEYVLTSNWSGASITLEEGQNHVELLSKRGTCVWKFRVTSQQMVLRRVLLLDSQSRSQFLISGVTLMNVSNRAEPADKTKMRLVADCQEWERPTTVSCGRHAEVEIHFRAVMYGQFEQTIVFDFGSYPVFSYRVSVEVTSANDLEKEGEWLRLKNSLCDNSMPVITFIPRPGDEPEEDTILCNRYLLPMTLSQCFNDALKDPNITVSNYKQRMHALLHLEEYAQIKALTRFNVRLVIHTCNKYVVPPSSSISATKFANSGELFAWFDLKDEISEDTKFGRLVLESVKSVQVTFENSEKSFEALIEDKAKDMIYLRLSASCVTFNKLVHESALQCQIQFVLHRLSLCEMHSAVDKLVNLNCVLPCVSNIFKVKPTSPMPSDIDSSLQTLNTQQREAVNAIVMETDVPPPPILVLGPFGTGKTLTLAIAIKGILAKKDTRVLICTQSNSAADIYIREYLDKDVTGGQVHCRPLRVYYRHRHIAVVHPTVLKYCITESVAGGGKKFRSPTLEELTAHRVVIATLSTSRSLVDLNLPIGFFTHILLDEAAQALESKAIIPLCLAGPQTRVVLAGDPQQMNAEVFSNEAYDLNFHKSLLSRLVSVYPDGHPCRVVLCRNYRSHSAIVDFLSEMFYLHQLTACGPQACHAKLYPLSFVAVCGADVQHSGSTSFFNSAEICEVADKVREIQQSWPTAWGPLNADSIGVIAPYTEQVIRIRNELRRRNMGNVSVERIYNVQGKQFRVIIISTVRTYHTCHVASVKDSDIVDYAFLSNPHMLNTAITRAQSLVLVIGDAQSLCSIGECRRLWLKYIEVCHQHGSLFEITWQQLQYQLNDMESARRNLALNPNVAPFYPLSFMLPPQVKQQSCNDLIQSEPTVSRLDSASEPGSISRPGPVSRPDSVKNVGSKSASDHNLQGSQQRLLDNALPLSHPYLNKMHNSQQPSSHWQEPLSSQQQVQKSPLHGQVSQLPSQQVTSQPLSQQLPSHRQVSQLPSQQVTSLPLSQQLPSHRQVSQLPSQQITSQPLSQQLPSHWQISSQWQTPQVSSHRQLSQQVPYQPPNQSLHQVPYQSPYQSLHQPHPHSQYQAQQLPWQQLPESHVLQQPLLRSDQQRKMHARYEQQANESTRFNHQQPNESTRFNQQRPDESTRVNQQQLNESTRFNQQRPNESTRFNQQRPYESTRFNQQRPNESTRFNQQQPDESTRFNQQRPNESTRFNQQRPYESTRFNHQQPNESTRFNQQRPNESTRFNQQQPNESTRFNQQRPNESTQFNQQQPNESTRFNQQRPNESTRFNQQQPNESTRFNQQQPNESTRFIQQTSNAIDYEQGSYHQMYLPADQQLPWQQLQYLQAPHSSEQVSPLNHGHHHWQQQLPAVSAASYPQLSSQLTNSVASNRTVPQSNRLVIQSNVTTYPAISHANFNAPPVQFILGQQITNIAQPISNMSQPMSNMAQPMSNMIQPNVIRPNPHHLSQ